MSDSILFKQVSIANEDNSELLVSDVLIEDGIIMLHGTKSCKHSYKLEVQTDL